MTVHVWGPPEDAEMPSDGRLCTSDENGSLVVYHVAPFRTYWGQWSCAECRFHTIESRSDAIKRMRSRSR